MAGDENGAQDPRSSIVGYTIAVGASAASLAFRYLARDSFGLTLPYLQFYPVVILSSWFGGVGPGLLATGMCALAAMYLFLPPEGLAVGSPVDALSLGIFVATCAVVVWLNHRLRLSEAAHRTAASIAEARAERLEAILNTSVDGIIVIDAQGRIESFNQAAERLFGYPLSEVLGRNVSLLMPSPYHEEHDDYLKRYLTTGEARIIGVGRQVTARRRDGSVFPVQLSVGEMRIGAERKFTGLLQDLTKRVGLEDQLGASEARWRAVIESAVDGIIVIDSHGRIETFNPAAERLFGYSADEVMGRNVDMLMPPPYREEHDTYLARYLTTRRARIIGTGRDVQGQRKDGSVFPLHLSVGEITIGGVRKFTGILHDLTSRQQIEQTVREQASLVRLGEMAAVIAHEVKNPLAGIRGAIQVLAGRASPDDPHVVVLKEIISRIDSLDGMVKDILLFARAPKPKKTLTDMASLVRDTGRLLQQDPAWHGVSLAIAGTAPPLSVDPDMLRIVFQNLLINSAQAMRGQGSVQVSMETGDKTCEIALADSGPGIPPDIREKIFTPFFTTKSRGSGLGLATAKRMIEAHEGHIAIDCPTAGGTRVVITLPVAAL